MKCFSAATKQKASSTLSPQPLSSYFKHENIADLISSIKGPSLPFYSMPKSGKSLDPFLVLTKSSHVLFLPSSFPLLQTTWQLLCHLPRLNLAILSARSVLCSLGSRCPPLCTPISGVQLLWLSLHLQNTVHYLHVGLPVGGAL